MTNKYGKVTMMKKKLIIILTVCIIELFAFGVYTIAVSGAGTEADPLVTLSYLNDVVLKQLKQDTETELTAKLSELEAQLASEYSSSASADASDGYTVVTLNKGETLIGNVGTEIILRIGSVNCVASSSPGLIDATDGGTIDNGANLGKNHLYIVTIDGRGVKAEDRATLVVKGAYKVG
jgi:hypothetical protein